MRKLIIQSASDGEGNLLAAVACLAMLLFIVIGPTAFHTDPIASGVLLVGP